jgi:hypothetical protein
VILIDLLRDGDSVSSRENVFDMYGDSRENLFENVGIVILLRPISFVQDKVRVTNSMRTSSNERCAGSEVHSISAVWQCVVSVVVWCRVVSVTAVVQCGTVCCSVLQCVAECCRVLHLRCTPYQYCGVVQHGAVCCIVLHCVALFCI